MKRKKRSRKKRKRRKKKRTMINREKIKAKINSCSFYHSLLVSVFWRRITAKLYPIEFILIGTVQIMRRKKSKVSSANANILMV